MTCDNGAKRWEEARGFQASGAGFEPFWSGCWWEWEQQSSREALQKRLCDDDVHGDTEGLRVLRGHTCHDQIALEAPGQS